MYFDNVAKYKANQTIFQPTRDSIPSQLLVDLLSKERVGVQPTIGVRNVMMEQAQEMEDSRVYAAGAAWSFDHCHYGVSGFQIETFEGTLFVFGDFDGVRIKGPASFAIGNSSMWEEKNIIFIQDLYHGPDSQKYDRVG
jgi:hypothetical protein